MATTRSYRLNRIALELELAESARRAAWNAAALEAAYRERVAAGVAPMEPAELVALFQRDAAAAWGALAAVTREQRINQAIEVACWLEGQDRPISWGAILDKWESHLAENTGEKAPGSHAGAREDAIVCADASDTAAARRVADELAVQGLRPATADEAGWYYTLESGNKAWATDEPAPVAEEGR